MSLAHYVFVRKDLPLGVLAAMVTHAAGSSASKRLWPLPSDTVAVVLEAKDEPELFHIAGYLKSVGINNFSLVFEDNGTYAGQFMAIGIDPIERDKVSDYLKPYNILRECKMDLDNHDPEC